MIYITQYAIKGSRCTGTYAVNAASKSEANSIIKSINEEYKSLKSFTEAEYSDWDDMMEDVPELGEGEYFQIECGT